MEEILASVGAVERFISFVLLLTSIARESTFRWIDKFQDVRVAEVYLIILKRRRSLGRRCRIVRFFPPLILLVFLLDSASKLSELQ